MATIKDIAKLAGVSTATVSRILNGKGGASKEIAERVLGIAKAVNYRPNNLARSLSRGDSSLIAIMIPDMSNPFFPELVSEIERVCLDHDLQVLICNTMDRRDKIEYFLNTIVDNHALGAVVCTRMVTQEDLTELENRGVHTVTTDRSSFVHPYSAVNVDQVQGSFIATRRLIDKGRQRILLISGPDIDQGLGRETGYRMALADRNVKYSRIESCDYTMSGGFETTTKVLSENKDQKEQIDGIVATNDLMAIGAMRACRDHGLVIPEDISIIGNDNLDIDGYITPRLSSLSQCNTKVAKVIVDELLNVARKDGEPRKISIEPELILRASD